MGQVQFGGSWFQTIGQAAAAWAATALPDVSVISEGEDVVKAATDLEAFWWGEAQKIGEGAPEDVNAHDWRASCRGALVARIVAHRASA